MLQHAKSFGLNADKITYDFIRIIERSRKVAEINSKGVEYLMKKNKIDVISGRGKLKNSTNIEVTDLAGKSINIIANHIIIATGGRPKTIPGVEIDGEKIIEYRKAMSLEHKPSSMIVIGAGAIGIEFAYFYNQFGTQITIVEMLDSILPVEDREITSILTKSFKRSKIDIHTSTKVENIKKTKTGVQVTISSNGKSEILNADLALMAIGIQGNIENLGLEDLGVNTEKSFIPVNSWYETNTKGIYAIGDVTGPPLLAHVASHEGIICVEKIADQHIPPLDYSNIPGCTYCQPQVASIGLTEEKAKEAKYEIDVGKFPYTASGKARAIGEKDGLVKVIFDKKYGELLGAHIIGAEATELIAELSMAKSLEATPVEIIKTMHAHPTLSEMIMEAAAAAKGEAIHI
jgi:dihydrolipoamide dehydrogenase